MKRNAKELLNTKVPARPSDLGSNRGNTSFFFTQYVMQGHTKNDLRSEDPREALLKMDSVAKADPMFLGSAYANTQPQSMMHSMTFEEEQEDFKKKQKKVL